MKTLPDPELYIALVHYPVCNKNGETIASAVTNLDLHDIARASRTYGIRRYYVITPLADQQNLAEKILSHWITGSGATYNQIRGKALSLVTIRDSIETVLAEIQEQSGRRPKTIATSAQKDQRAIGYPDLRKKLGDTAPHLLLFGTAWGLAPEVIQRSDFLLKPILANADYNHLSVRSAVSIILDRLLCRERIA